MTAVNTRSTVKPENTHLWKIFHRKLWSGGWLMCGCCLYGLWYAILKGIAFQKWAKEKGLKTLFACFSRPVVVNWLLSNGRYRLPPPLLKGAWPNSHYFLEEGDVTFSSGSSKNSVCYSKSPYSFSALLPWVFLNLKPFQSILCKYTKNEWMNVSRPNMQFP